MPSVLPDMICDSCGDRHTLYVPGATYAYTCPVTGEEVRHRFSRWANVVPILPPGSVLLRLVE
jgi:hypothetical protein